MGRALRRKLQKEQKQLDLRERLEQAYRQQKEDEKMVLTAMREAEEFTKHHITGELYTAMAVVLRRPPYRWPAEKVMRYLDAVGAIINDLNDGTTCDADLVTEGERWGIRVTWDASHRYIDGLSEFEERAEK